MTALIPSIDFKIIINFGLCPEGRDYVWAMWDPKSCYNAWHREVLQWGCTRCIDCLWGCGALDLIGRVGSKSELVNLPSKHENASMWDKWKGIKLVWMRGGQCVFMDKIGTPSWRMNRQKRREFRAEEWQEDLDGEDELEGYENLGIESNLCVNWRQ